MLKGEKSLLTCKPDFGYGEKGSPPKIPPNATLQFEVELLSWKGNDISGDGGVIMNVLQKGSDSDYYRPKDGAEVEGVFLSLLMYRFVKSSVHFVLINVAKFSTKTVNRLDSL